MPHVGNFPERGCPKPLSIPPGAFVPKSGTQDSEITNDDIVNSQLITAEKFYAPVLLPHRATVTKLTLYGFKNTSGGYVTLTLLRGDRQGTSTVMATCSITLTTGYQSAEDDTINDPEIDNENYEYGLQVEQDADAVVTDNRFTGAKIDWN